MVWDDAADKVRVGVSEGGHEVTQLLLVQLAHGAEHALTGFERTVHGVRHSCHFIQAHNTVHCDDAKKEEKQSSNCVSWQNLS